MLQRLSTALSQVKTANIFENLLNDIQIIYSLYQSKEIAKKIHNNIMNSIKLIQNRCCIYEFWNRKNIWSS